MIPYNDETIGRILKVVDRLNGTCVSVDTEIEDEFGEDVSLSDLDPRLLEELDSHIEQCEDCGYWTDIAVMEDGVCDDCRGEE